MDENGNTVSDQRTIDLLEKCGVDDTANRIANFKGGDLEALIEEYKAAVACFEEEGFPENPSKSALLYLWQLGKV